MAFSSSFFIEYGFIDNQSEVWFWTHLCYSASGCCCCTQCKCCRGARDAAAQSMEVLQWWWQMENFLWPMAQDVYISGCHTLQERLCSDISSVILTKPKSKKDKKILLLFTWLIFPLAVKQAEPTKPWPISPVFARLSLQTVSQSNLFLPFLHVKLEARSHGENHILQPPLNVGFKLLQWLPSNGTISEKLGEKWSQQDPILLPLDFSSKKAQEEESDL